MKTCPVCGETYSERIDFCFNDGAVLELMPSALDAPVPRRIAVASGPVGAQRLRTGRTVDFEPEDVEVRPPVPAHEPPPPPRTAAPEAPPAARLRPEDDPALAGPTAVPPPPAAPPPTVGEAPAPPATPEPLDFDEQELEEARGRRAAPAFVWFGIAALLGVVLVVAVLPLVVSAVRGEGTPARTEERPVEPAAAAAAAPPQVTPPAPPVPRPPEPEAVATAPSAEAAPSPDVTEPLAEERPPAVAAAGGSQQASARPRAPSGPPQATAAPVAAAAPPPPTPQPAPPASAAPVPNVRVLHAPVPTVGSPWDAPQASEGVARFTSDPPGAVVRIDGKLRGKTPVDVKLPFGSHQVELSLDGYQSVARTVEVRSAELKVPSVLEPAVREGNVLVVLPGRWHMATLYVDGVARGRVIGDEGQGRPPALELRLTEGPHVFDVRLGDARAVDRRAVDLSDRGVTRLVLDPR